MIFDESIIHSMNKIYEPEKFKLRFDSLLIVEVKSFGFIDELNLICPSGKTKMRLDMILKYQEEGYNIVYGDEFLEDVLILINLYNKKLELDHMEKRNLRISPLVKSHEYIIKKMRRQPEKYASIIGDPKLLDNPFNDAFDVKEEREKISSLDHIAELDAQEELRSTKITWEERERNAAAVAKYMDEFRRINQIGKFGEVDFSDLKNIKKINNDDLPSYNI